MKKLSKNLAFIVSGIIFIAAALTIYLWTSSYSSWILREQLTRISPLFLEINFILIIVAVVITIISCRKSSQFKEVFGKIPLRIWIRLAVISITGLIMVVFVVPQEHRIYYDEDIYQNIAQNIAYTKGEGSHQGENYLESLGSFWKRFVGRAGMCNEGKNEYEEYECLRLEYNKEPNGWAYILSVVFRLFGVHEEAAFLTTNVIFLLTIITVFLSGYLLFEDYYAALYSALILSLTPEVMMWCNTVAVEPSAMFFPALAVLGTLFFLKTRNTAALFMTGVITAFAIQFRPEAVMICAVIGLLIIFRGADELKRERFYLLAALFLVLIIPLAVHLWAVRELGWGSGGNKFFLSAKGPWYWPDFSLDLDGFQNNLKVNTLFYVRNMRFPAVFTALFLLGIFLAPFKQGMSDKKGGAALPIFKRTLLMILCGCRSFMKSVTYQGKEKLVLFVWLLLFWGIFILFYAGSYNYGADVRFSLLSAVPISLLAGNGASLLALKVKQRLNIHRIDYIIASVIIAFFISFLPFIRAITQEAWAARADHRFARQMAEALPQDSVVLTHNPNMFLLWGKSAAQASLVTEQREYFRSFFFKYKGGIYFHYNFWCNVNDPQQNSFCTNILKRFNCTPVMSFKEKNYKFVLYKVEK